MMDRSIKTKGLAFVEALGTGPKDKENIFSHLYQVVGRNCEISHLGLPSDAAIAYLESSKAKCQIKAYEPRIADTFTRLTKVSKIEHKRDLLDQLNIMTPKPRDYAVIALDSYLKLDKKNHVEGFYMEYNDYKLHQSERSSSSAEWMFHNFAKDQGAAM